MLAWIIASRRLPKHPGNFNTADWATVCKTIRSMLSDSCLSCLSVTLVYCGQTAAWIKMPLGTEVGLGPGDIVRWGPSSPPQKRGHSSPLHFSVHVYYGQTVAHLSNC